MSDDLGIDGLKSITTGRAQKRVQIGGTSKRKPRKKALAERPDPKLNATQRRTRKLTYTFADVSRERWNKAFGNRTPEQQAEIFRNALQEQKNRQSTSDAPRSTAIHGDNKGAGRRIHRGFDYGLGCYVEGKAHRREVMRRMNVIATG